MAKKIKRRATHANTVLTSLGHIHARGLKHEREKAFWEAIQFCEINGVAKPAWLRDGLADYARDRVTGRPMKRREGRPDNWIRDAGIRDRVNFWRTQKRTLDEALGIVTDELREWVGENVAVDTVRTAYRRALKRYSPR